MEEMIPLFKVFMSHDVDKPLLDVLHSGFIGQGIKVDEFEKIISEKLQLPHVLTVNSGTSALHLAYQMIINGDENSEFIVSPTTCSATLTPILANKGKIVWADIDPISGNIDPISVKRRITKNTKAIIMVHWGGNLCDIDELNKIAELYGIKTIEDGAHSLGATLHEKYVGSFSDFTIFSLQAIKHVTSIDGGILICKEKKFYDRAKLLRWYGIDRTENRQTNDLRCELDISEAGHKFHMHDCSAVVGMENFKYLDFILAKHRSNAGYYNSIFKNTNIGAITPLPGVNPAWWLYTINVYKRDDLMNLLKIDGIGASKVHASNLCHSMFKHFYKDLPMVDKFNKTHLCIPVGWWVSVEDREYIAKRVLFHIANLGN
jgi:dTDP-4-amino-4,6-dideoxygalactose transaminase